MLDIGFPEFLLISFVLLIVVGPKDLPKVLRSVSSFIRKRYVNGFWSEFTTIGKVATHMFKRPLGQTYFRNTSKRPSLPRLRGNSIDGDLLVSLGVQKWDLTITNFLFGTNLISVSE